MDATLTQKKFLSNLMKIVAPESIGYGYGNIVHIFGMLHVRYKIVGATNRGKLLARRLRDDGKEGPVTELHKFLVIKLR